MNSIAAGQRRMRFSSLTSRRAPALCVILPLKADANPQLSLATCSGIGLPRPQALGRDSCSLRPPLQDAFRLVDGLKAQTQPQRACHLQRRYQGGIAILGQSLMGGTMTVDQRKRPPDVKGERRAR